MTVVPQNEKNSSCKLGFSLPFSSFTLGSKFLDENLTNFI
jgi:hypothetical protein